MKVLSLLFFISISSLTTAQEYDSAWVAKAYFPRFTVDTGQYLADSRFVDEKGNVKTLADYRGKLLYIDVWTTWCGPCRLNFELLPQLLQRLKLLHLDTAVQFINICTEDSKRDWKKALKKIKPLGINLYSLDTTIIYQGWQISLFPATILLDTSGRVMAKDFTDAREPVITDFLLYAATKGIKPAESIWINFRQRKYFEKNRSYSPDAEGRDYSAWFKSLTDLFVEHYQLNQKRK